MKLLTLGAVFGLLCGCSTNPFAIHYHDNTAQWPEGLRERLLPAAPRPEIVVVPRSDQREQTIRLFERSFVPIGSAGFVGGRPSRAKLIDQAKGVGADFVLYSSEYSHTETGVDEVTKYKPGQTYITTSYGSATANVYSGPSSIYGSGFSSGYSVTTTPGATETHYVPYERRVDSHIASFWRRVKPNPMGAVFRALPDDVRRKLQRNTGICVLAVVQDGPAFRANVLRDDVLIQVADKEITTISEALSTLRAYSGQQVRMKFLRENRVVEIDVRLGE